MDSLGRDTRNQVDGRRIIRTGQRTLLAGGIATVAGGLGLRVRMDTRKPTSLWTSIHGDASASYLHFGLKFGWAF